MFRILFTAVLGLSVSTAHCQSIVDLAEQLALDAEKLTSMKATLQEMYQGYEELQTGYTRIRDIAKGSFNLHEVFLDALLVLSPAVRDDPRLTEIINTEYRIVQVYKAATGSLGSQSVWTGQELGYINGVLGNLLQRSAQTVEELTMISTDNTLRMDDGQRLQALGRIDTEIKEELSFLQRYSEDLAVEAGRRAKESNDINTLKSIYGLPN